MGLFVLWLFMVRLQWLRNMNSHRCPWEVVGLHWLRLRILRRQYRVVRRSLAYTRVGPCRRKPGGLALLWEHHLAKYLSWGDVCRVRAWVCERGCGILFVWEGCSVWGTLHRSQSVVSAQPRCCPEVSSCAVPGCVISRGFSLLRTPLSLLRASPLFHRVAGLREEHQTWFHAVAKAGKAVASALPSRRRDRDCCSDPLVAFSVPMIPVILRFVRALSSSALCPSLLRRQRGWNLCVKGCWRLTVGVLVFFGPLALAEGVGIQGSGSLLCFWFGLRCWCCLLLLLVACRRLFRFTAEEDICGFDPLLQYVVHSNSSFLVIPSVRISSSC